MESRPSMGVGSSFRALVSGGAGGLIAVGAILVALGLVALVVPPLVGLTTAFVLGWVFAIGGVVQFIHAVQERHAHPIGWLLVSALLRVVAGLLLIVFPGVGTVALTATLAAYFFISGVVKTIRAFQARGLPAAGWLLFDGLVSIALGIIAWGSFPASSMWLIGTLVGVELVFAGVAAISLGVHADEATVIRR